MNVCPDCETPLALTATSCRCGWTLPVTVVRPQTRAEIEERELAEHLERAKESLKAKGLDRKPGESDEDWRRRSLEGVGGIKLKRFGKAA